MLILILTIIFTLIGPSNLFAEYVLLKTGRVVEGELVEKTDDHIRIKTKAGVKKILFKIMDKDFAKSYQELPELIMPPPEAPVIYKGRRVAKKDVDTEDIFRKAISAYGAMDSFQCQGIGISNIKFKSYVRTAQSFLTLLFKRPNYYFIFEETAGAGELKETQAVWRDGESRYYYSSKNKKYSELPTDSLAWISVTYFEIFKKLFFGCEEDCSFSKEWTYYGNLVFKGEDCYLFSKSNKKGSLMIWISEVSHLVQRVDYDFEGNENEFFVRMVPATEMNKIFPAMDVELTAANQSKTRVVLKDIYRMKPQEGFNTYSEVIIDNIVINPKLVPGHFKFTPPPGVDLISLEEFKKNFVAEALTP